MIIKLLLVIIVLNICNIIVHKYFIGKPKYINLIFFILFSTMITFTLIINIL